MKKIVLFAISLLMVACASVPQGPQFSKVSLPAPDEGKAVLVVYRDYAEPTAVNATIFAGKNELFSLPQKSFAYVMLEQGSYSMRLKWPVLSGTPGWEGEINLNEAKTYYYQLKGSAGGGFYYRSSLGHNSAPLALANLKLCCKLITELKDQATLKTPGSPTAMKSLTGILPVETVAENFKKLEVGMSPKEVFSITGSPSKISSRSTGKQWIPFYFGSDSRRTYWSYKGVGYAVFSRNKYTGNKKLVETRLDTSAL
jgi:hypothetical protein